METTRRHLLVLALVSAVGSITRARAWASPLDPKLRRWILGVGEIAAAVRAGTTSPSEWQDAMSDLYADLDPSEIVRFIDMEALLEGLRHPPERLGGIVQVHWPEVQGLPKTPEFSRKLFVYRRGACTPPHVHNHLVSAHWVLEGEIRTRTFDRVRDLDDAILLRATRDEVCGPGALITMSDQRDNGHWFEGLTERSVSLDIPISGVPATRQYRHPAEGYNQIFVDPTVAPDEDGSIRAPIIAFAESLRRFA